MKHKLYIVGIGPGSKDYINKAVMDIINSCQVIIGGNRNLALFKHLEKEEYVIGNNLKQLTEFIKDNIHIKRIVVTVTGDPGLYSFMEYLQKNLEGIEIEVLPGISAFQYLCAKLKMSWNDIYITSLHGRENSEFVNIIRRNYRTAVFAGGGNTPNKICSLLRKAEIKSLKIIVGENLSYEQERIVWGSVEEIEKMGFDSLSIMIIENPNYANREASPKCDNNDYMSIREDEDMSMGEFPAINIDTTIDTSIGIPDGEFIRGNVPMTKEEIRTISISKLRLRRDSVVCDIGAGTGSVAIECGRICRRGKVYAVECNPDGIDLIKKNIYKFNLNNVSLIEGKAPKILHEALNGVHPDRFFIGGTKGNMDSILEWISTLNKEIIVVINTVTIESTYEAIKGLEHHGFIEIEVLNISISKSMEAGDKHLMKAINPVTIISGKRFAMESVAEELK